MTPRPAVGTLVGADNEEDRMLEAAVVSALLSLALLVQVQRPF